MKPLVIFGSGQIAEVADYYFRKDSPREVAAFCVDREFLTDERFLDRPLVAFEELPTRYPPQDFDLFVAVSYQGLNRLRAEKVAEARGSGYALASYVSTRATVLSEIPEGGNRFVLENNVIQPFATIGENVTLWSGNHIGHHSTIADHCFVSSHVVVSGGVTVEPYCFLGVNATLRDGIRIGESSVIGAGTLLLEDAPPASVYRSEATARARVPSHRLRGI